MNLMATQLKYNVTTDTVGPMKQPDWDEILFWDGILLVAQDRYCKHVFLRIHVSYLSVIHLAFIDSEMKTINSMT